MKELACDVVRCCDEFSLPADEEEITRRRMENLTYRQELHLLQWGYPYIFRDCIFHMSLTGRLKTDERKTAMHTILASIVGEFTEKPLPIEAIYIFHQAGRSKPFNVMQRIQLGEGE